MTAYLSALAICAASLLVGAALTRPGPARAAAPAVGLAGVMLIVLAAIRLPGHGDTAAAALGLVLLIALVRLWPERDIRPLVEAMPVVVGVTALCSLSFLVNGRFGELGVSVLDDISFHLAQADAMRTLGGGAHVIAAGYPSGPHAVVAAVADGIKIGVSPAFTGLLIAIPVLTALSAFAVIPGRSRVLRWVGAVVVGLSYLCAGYFVQSAFKETLMALFLLGSALVIRDAHLSRELNLGHVLMLGLITGASVATFGPAGAVWPAAAVLLLGLADAAYRWRTGGPRWRFTRVHAVAAAAALGGAVLVAGTFGSGDFFESGPGEFFTTTGVGGNYAGQLNPLEALGIWSNADFRYAGTGRGQLLGVILAIAAVLHGALWCSTRRREWAVLAGATAAVAIYLVARPTTLAYNTGKALVIAAPILALIAVLALAGRISVSGGTVRRVALVAFAAYVLLAGYSSTLALRGAHVRPREIGPDLGAFRHVVRGHNTLFVGRDNFAGWELRGSRLWGFQPYRTAVTPLDERPGKTAGDESPPAVDVDSIDWRFLDAFDYLVTSRTAYASRLPDNYRPVRRTPWHLLWKRSGATAQRLILEEGEAPGAVFDCRLPGLRRLSRGPGSAYIRPRPVVGSVASWRKPDGSMPPGRGNMPAGGTLRQTLQLRPGTWDISIRYFSDVDLTLRAGPLDSTLPAYLSDRASFLSAGRVTTQGGRLDLQVHADEPSRLGLDRTTLLGTVAATRVDDPGRLVPMRRACGRYVDWYDPSR